MKILRYEQESMEHKREGAACAVIEGEQVDKSVIVAGNFCY